MPSVVEFDTGRVVSSVNVPLRDVKLRNVLQERVGVPVFVDNDATVAALAEAHDEHLNLVARDLVMITVGTGVGGGVVIGGRIYRGATGGAGEFGHTIVGLDLAGRCPRRRSTSLSRGRSSSSLRDTPWTGLPRRRPSCIRSRPSGQLRARGNAALGPDAVAAARAGDPMAQRIVETWGEHLGIGIANAINTFDPEEVVIGGGAAQAGELLLEPARRIALGYVVPGLSKRTTVRLARHGLQAGVLGAALLAVHELEHASPQTRTMSEVSS